MELVPTNPVPAQTFTVILANQQVQITLRQLNTGLYMDLQSNGQEVVGLVICEVGNRIVRNSYFGFKGDLAFMCDDILGPLSDPFYTGLGTKYLLYYLSEDDLLVVGKEA